MGRPEPGRARRAAIVLGCALAGALGAPALAAAAGTGPPLDVPQASLDASLRCSATFDTTAGEPLLLIPGTGATPKQNFDRSWTPALDALGRRWCTVELPQSATGDIQVAGAYVTSAIRTMAARAHGRIAMVGHSQGGMVGRWSLKWWPDTRAMVSDYVSIAGSNHGTVLADAACAAMPCTPANWQQASRSQFLQALNAGAETWAPVAYTSVYTLADEVVQPNQDATTGSTSLRTGAGERANIALQSVCPTDTSEHLLVGSVDNTAFRLALDAVDRPGTADADAVRRQLLTSGTCLPPNLIPGVDLADLTALSSEYAANPSAPAVPAEPALKCYVTDTCPAAAAPPAGTTPAPAAMSPAAAATAVATAAASSAAVAAAAPAPAAPAAPARRRAAQLTTRLVATRDRRAPFAFTVRGTLVLPSGVSAAAGCRGSVVVRVQTRAGKTVSSRRVPVGADCRVRSRVAFRAARRLGRSGRLVVRARFAGNAALLPASASARTARAG